MSRPAVLLFPGPDACELDEIAGRDLDLVVVDATWPVAKNIVRYTPRLSTMPRVKLPLGEKSRYRIRLQPRAECVSTLEAAVRALAVLEGGRERFEPLLDAFDRMVDRHIAQAAAAGRSVIRNVRADTAHRPLPETLAGPLESLVIVHGETLWTLEDGSDQRKVELVHWSAHRLGTGETIDVALTPKRAFRDSEAAYVGLSRTELENGRSDLPRIWGNFVRSTDTFVSWGFFASNAFGRMLGTHLKPQVDLRGVSKHILNRKVPRPENGLLELDLGVPAPLARGRCGLRLAMLRCILEALRSDRGLPVTAVTGGGECASRISSIRLEPSTSSPSRGTIPIPPS